VALDLKRTAFLLTLGLLCIVFAAVLEWWASPAMLSLTRTGPNAVSMSMVSYLFGQLPTTTTRYDGVQSVAMVSSPNRRRSAGSDRLVFYTAAEAIDRTRAQQLFRADFQEIRSFFSDGSSQTLSIWSIARAWERWRFVAAQAAVAFLTLLGVGVIALGVKEILHRNRDVLIRGVDY
jgi:hypothetical protein